ncbi:MAG: trigger factor [Caulobacteraceae bacterium]
MQIVEKSGEGLSRVYGVTVLATTLKEKLDAKIAEISPKMQVKGFRPGKVPAAHVKRMYGKSLMSEIIEETVTQSRDEALSQAKARPATTPDITLASDMDKVLTGDSDLAFDVSVELMPDFEPIDFSGVKLKRPVHMPTDAEIDEQLAEIASNNRTYETKGGKAPKAADGDMVVIDFVGSVDGVEFDGGKGEDAELVIGSGRFIPGFEEQLLGAKADQDVTVSVTFPEDYPAEALKGKAAQFAVKVKDVRAAKDSAPDDALAERLGLENLDALKAALKAQIEQENQGASRFKVKRALLDVLDAGHDFPLPPRMVDGEFQTIWQQVQAERAAGELSDEDKAKTEKQLEAEYRQIAARRVRLGLVLAEIGRRNDVTVSDEEMNRALIAEARKYPGQEREVFEFFRQNPQAAAQLRAPVYEEKVVDLILSKAKVTDTEVSKDKLFEEDELPASYGGEAEAKPKAKKAAEPKAKKVEAAAETKPKAKKAAEPKAKK